MMIQRLSLSLINNQNIEGFSPKLKQEMFKNERIVKVEQFVCNFLILIMIKTLPHTMNVSLYCKGK